MRIRQIQLTSHSKVELLHDDSVLKVRVASKVEANPVAKFIVFEGLNLYKHTHTQ